MTHYALILTVPRSTDDVTLMTLSQSKTAYRRLESLFTYCRSIVNLNCVLKHIKIIGGPIDISVCAMNASENPISIFYPDNPKMALRH